jgi:hypothetical protein
MQERQSFQDHTESVLGMLLTSPDSVSRDEIPSLAFQLPRDLADAYASRLLTVLQVCLLKELGIEGKSIERILDHNASRELILPQKRLVREVTPGSPKRSPYEPIPARTWTGSPAHRHGPDVFLDPQ